MAILLQKTQRNRVFMIFFSSIFYKQNE